MHTRQIMKLLGILTLVIGLMLIVSGCGGGETTPVDTDNGENTSEATNTESSENDEATESNPTPELAATFPDVLVMHPDAYDIEITEASGAYVYQVPLMVKETTEYLIEEQEALGWEIMGNPTVMGHLASLTLKMGEDRLTISMQDNELSESTRVQFQLMQQ